MTRWIIAPAVLCLSTVGFAPFIVAGERPAEDGRAFEAGPRDCSGSEAAVAHATERLVEADNKRDLSGVLAGYTEDVTWLPPTGEVLKGKDTIRPRYEQLFSGFAVSMSSEVAEARREGQLGYVRGFTKGTLTPLNGGAQVRVDDKFLALVRCESGVWLVSHLMWSPRIP